MAALSGVQELSQIPFDKMIGGPLKAAIEAQALAAKTTVDFIQAVGFLPDASNNGEDAFFPDAPAAGATNPLAPTKDVKGGDVRNVTFNYHRKDAGGDDEEVLLQVPILTIVPIPYIRIDELTIDFTSKLNDMVSNTSNSQFKLSGEATVKGGWGPVSFGLRVGSSYANQSKAESRYTREYQIKIHVRAVQDDLPGGMGRILEILEKAIDTPPAAPV